MYEKEKIEYLFQNSTFILTNEKNIFVEGYYDTINNKERKYLNINDFINLKNYAQINTKENIPRIIMEINNIYDLLKEFYHSGYPKKIKIQINIIKFEPIFFGFSLNTKDYLDIKIKLETILNDFRKAQLFGYRHNPLIRFIYGRQFSLIYNFIIGIEKDNFNISQILIFITNNLIKFKEMKFLEYSKFYINEENENKEIINNINNYLSEILKMNNINLENIYKESLIETKNPYKGIYYYLCDNIEITIYQIYKYLTKKKSKCSKYINL